MPITDSAGLTTPGRIVDDQDNNRVEVQNSTEDPSALTQDSNAKPAIVDKIAHQLHRVAEDPESDEEFESITSHEWVDGVLMFRFKWKTNEISSLPFSVVKRDFPMETAKFILHNRIANTASDSTGPRNFERQFNRILRRLIRMLDVDGTTSTPSPPNYVVSHLENGARRIRRIIHSGKGF